MDQMIHRCRAADGTDIAYATVGDGPPLVFTSWWPKPSTPSGRALAAGATVS